ncbi:MAG: ArsR family transcriptional regulator [Nitrososphaerales archaeon]
MRIESQKVQDAIIRALADEYSRKIILKTIDKAESVEELSRQENIPISTAYRRVNEMKDDGILTIERTILTEDGKKYELYRSAFKSLEIDLKQGQINMVGEFNEDVAMRLSRLWAQMRPG